MKPHIHCEMIKAWADGAEIEVYSRDGWEVVEMPSWFLDAEYRIKPEHKRLRVAEIKTHAGPHFLDAATNEKQADFIQDSIFFVRWVTDWIEYD